jgi:hypothetical protein
MTANTTTASRLPAARTNPRNLQSATRDILERLGGRIRQATIAGQLGPDRERELGRHTGARI